MLSKKEIENILIAQKIKKAEVEWTEKYNNEQPKTYLDYLLLISSLPSQSRGAIAEKIIIQAFNWDKNKASSEIGDATNKNGENIEIKVSYTNNSSTLNFLQIRPHHNIDYYLGLYIDLIEKNNSRLYLIPSEDLYKLAEGKYMHGTNVSNKENKYTELRYSILMNNKKVVEEMDKQYRNIELENILFKGSGK